MSKRLSEDGFQLAIQRLPPAISKRTIDIAYTVLVEGRPQWSVAQYLGVSRGAISQAVKRVWDARYEALPEGFVKVSVVLPEHKAFIVQQWAADSQKKENSHENAGRSATEGRGREDSESGSLGF